MSILEKGNLQLRYKVEGSVDAPWLILSNPLGANLEIWAPQMASLLENFRVLRYDVRGHGESSVPQGPYTIEQMGGDVLALMDEAGIKQAHFCGLTMGGLVGMWLAINHPARLNRLVLCNTAARIGTADMWNTRIETVGKNGMAWIIPQILERWFTADFLARVPKKVDIVRDMLANMSPQGYAAGCAAVRDADFREDLDKIAVPTLVIAGIRDKATTPNESRMLVEKIDGARFVELKASHLSNWEVSQTFAARMIDFLEA
ncbi:3-oxoadipate enol-lactonase [soil metagenome]